MAQTMWFTRGDGQRFHLTAGTPAYERAIAEGFRPDGPLPGDADEAAEAPAVDLRSMKKAELLEYAAGEGIEVNPKATNAVIISVIEEAEAEGQPGGE